MKNDIIIQELNRIASKSGGILKPEIVVEEAKSEDSPLHSRFTWDDSEAAHQYRLEQARRLIRVTVQFIPNVSNEPERIWVSLKQDQNNEGGGYRTLVSVLSDVELRKQLLKEAMEDMDRFEEKYSHLNELSEIFKAMKRIRGK